MPYYIKSLNENKLYFVEETTMDYANNIYIESFFKLYDPIRKRYALEDIDLKVPENMMNFEAEVHREFIKGITLGKEKSKQHGYVGFLDTNCIRFIVEDPERFKFEFGAKEA